MLQITSYAEKANVDDGPVSGGFVPTPLALSIARFCRISYNCYQCLTNDPDVKDAFKEMMDMIGSVFYLFDGDYGTEYEEVVNDLKYSRSACIKKLWLEGSTVEPYRPALSAEQRTRIRKMKPERGAVDVEKLLELLFKHYGR